MLLTDSSGLEEAGERKSSEDQLSAQDKVNYDIQWKNIIKMFFYPMLQSLMPKLAEDADRSREPEYLEQELSDITAAIDGGAQHVDILAKIPMKRGSDIWLVLHIEIQGEKGGNLPERMFFYNSAIRLKHLKKANTDTDKDEQKNEEDATEKISARKKRLKLGITDVVSFAILTAHRPKGEEDFFERSSYGNRLLYEYPAIKLWELDETALAESGNPFDWALLSGLYVIKSGRKDISRFSYLKTLGEMLDSKGWSLDEKVALYRFMEMILRPKSVKLQTKYRKWVSERKKEGEQVYISVAEEIGMEKGIIKGRAELVRNLLSLGVDKEKIAEAAGLSVQELEELAKES